MATKDYEEQLFESMKVIAEKCIKAINYDATKQAEIVDDTCKAQGWYQVKIDGTVTCKAHPIDKDTEYKTGDKVVILIPNNDINEQKIILSKWADESADAYVYESPMESMIDVTGNLIDNTIKLSTDGLVANDQYNSTTLDPFLKERYINEHDEEQPGSWRHLGTIKNDNFPLIGYSILGLKANFRTLLSQCVEGDYGLRLRLLCAPPQEIAQYNNALDTFERLKSACLRFVNLYMKANKNGGKTDTRFSNNNVVIKAYQLFSRITANDNSNPNLSNKLYVDIYQAYLEIVKLFTEFEQSVDWKRSVKDGGLIEDTDIERTMIHYLHLSQGDNVYSAWLQEMLYDLEQQDLVLTHTRYYTSAAVTTDWDNIYNEIKAKASEASRDNLEFAWLTCYNWILETCSDYVDLTKNWQTDTSYYKSNLAPLTIVDFNQCAYISQLTTYLLQNNKYTKITSASGLIAIDSTSANTNNLLKNVIEVSMYLTPKEMIGAIYNCPDGYIQEAIFPIENLGAIYFIDVDLYERPGSFYYFNDDGELTPYPYLYNDAGELNSSAIQDILIEDAWGSAIDPGYTATVNGDTQQRVADNIFVNDIYICAGYKKDYYNEEQAILYTKQSNTYSPDTVTAKEVSVRWVHKNEETGRFNIVTLQDFDTTKYRIQWYQTDYMSTGDQWSGSQWRQLSQYDNSFYCNFTPRANDYQKELIRCIILAGSMDNDTFVPTEIVVKSNILTFENETDLAKTKLEEINLTEGLNIICEDGSNGAYFVYDEMFKTVNKAFHTKQKLSLVINNQAIDTAVDINELPKVAAVDSIEWIIPVNNSMIKFYWDNDLITKDFVLNNEYYKSQQILLEGTSNDNNQRVDKIKIISKQTITGEDNLYKLYYQIPQTYNPDKTDNTVMCTVKLPNDTYTMATKLSFMLGQASTNGYPYSLVVSFANMENQALIADRNTDSIEFNLSIRDINNNKWLSLNTNNVLFESLQDDPDILVPFYDIEAVSNSQQNNEITTLKITYTPLGRVSFYKAYIITIGYKVTNNIQLITKIPIPVQMDSSYNRLIYAPSPIINYNSDGSLSGNPLFKYSYNNENPIGQFELQRLMGTNVQPETSVADIGWIENNIFHPHPFYVQQANFYGIVCKINGYRQWQCPIIRQEYQYPYAALNKWNGQDIVIDNEGGHVIAPRIGAGKKNDDNTFSGVILGDWADDSELDGQKLTGLYGLRSGLMTYGFKEDGTAFIGPSDSGRILFDGANGVIKSNSYSTWSNSTLPTDSSNNLPNSGMYINFSRGQLYANGLSGSIKINPNDNSSLFTISAKPFTETVYEPLMQVGLQSFYLKSWNFSNWNQATGHTYGDTDWLNEKYGMYTVTYGSPDAGGFLDITYTNIATRSASTATHIPSNNKKITVLNQEVDLTDSPVAFQVGPTGSYFNLQTGLLYTKNGYFCGDVYAKNGYFNGTVYANAGEIGGCKIENGKLTVNGANITGTLTAAEISASKIKGGTFSSNGGAVINFNNGTFQVDAAGNMSATNGYIKGTVSADTAYIKGFVSATSGYFNAANIVGKLAATQIDTQNISITSFSGSGNYVTYGTSHGGIKIPSATTGIAEISGFKITPDILYHEQSNTKDFFIQPDGDNDNSFQVPGFSARQDWIIFAKSAVDTTSSGFGITNTGAIYGRNSYFAAGALGDIFSFDNDSTFSVGETTKSLAGLIGKKDSTICWLAHNRLLFADQRSNLNTASPRSSKMAGLYYTRDSASVGTIIMYGTWKSATGDTICTDSARYHKTDLMYYNYTNKASNIFFDNLKPLSFIYKTSPMRRHNGFIVDEVCAAAAIANVKPDDYGVHFSTNNHDPNDPEASICYSEFIALNTWQIQLLKKRVTTLEEKIKELEDKLNET